MWISWWAVLTDKQKAFLDRLTPEDAAWICEDFDLSRELIIIQNVQQMTFRQKYFSAMLTYLQEEVMPNANPS